MRQSPPPGPKPKQEQNTLDLRGVFAILTAGFEITTNHLWLILLPIFLDVFLWIGPRLSIRNLVEQSLAVFAEEPALAESFEQLSTQMLALAPQINLFTSISIPLIGIPALMSGGVPEATPVEPAVYPVDSAPLWLLLVLAFSLLGFLFSTVYLGLIARCVQPNEKRLQIGQFLMTLVQSGLRLVGLGIAFVLLVVAVSLPLLPIGLVLAFFSSTLFMVVMITGVILVALYLSLAVPGIFLNHRPLLPAILESFRLVRGEIFSTAGFYMLLIVISYITNMLWHMADDGSWITLVSIAGHGFISTSLVAAFFVYYRDRFAVWQRRLPRFEFGGTES